MTAKVQIAANLLDHHQAMFSKLFTKGEFSDLTLVSDDHTRIKAHKFVLSAFSPFFEKIIDENPTPHPVIYLRGIQSQELVSLLQFMYQGETQVFQSRMEEFGKVAQDLKVEKISKVLDGPEMQQYIEDEKTKRFKVLEENKIQVKTVKLKRPPTIQPRAKTITLKPRTLEETAVLENQVNSVNLIKLTPKMREDFEKQIDPLELEVPNEKVNTNNYSESIIEKDDNIIRELTVEDPLQTSQLETTCPECGKLFPGSSKMVNHYRLRHGDKTIACPHCVRKYPTKGSLQRHMKSTHQGIKYPCSQCDYKATTQADARKHRDRKHSNVILSCDWCHFETKLRSEYRRHMKTHDPFHFS